MTAHTLRIPSPGPADPTDQGLRVALVCMPFYDADRPSIQLGLLASCVRRAGFEAETFHLNLELAARLGSADYHWLCSHRGHMTGEWLFGPAAFGSQVCADDEVYFEAFPEEVSRAARGGKDRDYLSQLRHQVLPDFLDDCMTTVDWSRFDVIGFTSTFQQNVASLGLAHRIKNAHPQIAIVFGGANMEDEMGPEYARAFPFLDHVIIGEGEAAFTDLLTGLAQGQPPTTTPGLISRHGNTLTGHGQAPPVHNLDLLPTPHYDEYFQRAHTLQIDDDPQYAWMLPFETSRGCWWGQKHHCTFCGLNGLGMGFRSKTPERVLTELAELSTRHQLTFFGATDNILDMKHIQPLFGAIGADKLDYQFFYEVKANLTPAQIRTLHQGGIRWVQPGIESMSSHVLQLMRKGATMLQNLRLLKWCRYYHIRVSWNLIWGFPGETTQDYHDELAVLRLLSHLEPPHACTQIWLERFSPYFNDQDHYPITHVEPEASYRHLYPPELDLDLHKIAYFFDYQMADTLPADAHQPTQDWVQEWQQRHNSDHPDTLTYRRTTNTLYIDDHRGPDHHGTHTFHGPLALAYEYCTDTMQTPATITAKLHQAHHHYPEEEVRAQLDDFCTKGLMVTENNHYLGLALPTNPHW